MPSPILYTLVEDGEILSAKHPHSNSYILGFFYHTEKEAGYAADTAPANYGQVSTQPIPFEVLSCTIMYYERLLERVPEAVAIFWDSRVIPLNQKALSRMKDRISHNLLEISQKNEDFREVILDAIGLDLGMTLDEIHRSAEAGLGMLTTGMRVLQNATMDTNQSLQKVH